MNQNIKNCASELQNQKTWTPRLSSNISKRLNTYFVSGIRVFGLWYQWLSLWWSRRHGLRNDGQILHRIRTFEVSSQKTLNQESTRSQKTWRNIWRGFRPPPSVNFIWSWQLYQKENYVIKISYMKTTSQKNHKQNPFYFYQQYNPCLFLLILKSYSTMFRSKLGFIYNLENKWQILKMGEYFYGYFSLFQTIIHYFYGLSWPYYKIMVWTHLKYIKYICIYYN